MTDFVTVAAHQTAMQMIKEFEACRLEAYADVAGIPTIGWGTTHYENGEPVRLGEHITQERADALLAHDMVKFEKAIQNHVVPQLSPHQTAALISFVYNVGVGAFFHSTLLRYLNENDITAATGEFMKWVHAGGRVIGGLKDRRMAEAQMFEKGTRVA